MLDIVDKIRSDVIVKHNNMIENMIENIKESMTYEDIGTHRLWFFRIRTYINNISISIAKNYEAISKDNGKYRVKEEYIEEAFKEHKKKSP